MVNPGKPLMPRPLGQVVYAGSGLIGYGQLIILKHNDTYLSAYGYNASLLVKEGQAIKKGQRIATMGEGPERKPRLHFEIRRNGKPVKPATVSAREITRLKSDLMHRCLRHRGMTVRQGQGEKGATRSLDATRIYLSEIGYLATPDCGRRKILLSSGATRR